MLDYYNVRQNDSYYHSWKLKLAEKSWLEIRALTARIKNKKWLNRQNYGGKMIANSELMKKNSPSELGTKNSWSTELGTTFFS